MGEKKYRLGPFLVGWYEAIMRLLDKEFAELFEQFVIEGGASASSRRGRACSASSRCGAP